jgi:hypothetical protein
MNQTFRAATRAVNGAVCASVIAVSVTALYAQAPASPAPAGAARPAPQGGRGAAPTPPANGPILGEGGIPILTGTWDGGGRARPVNSETVPWGKDNFPVLTERGLAHQKVFDEALAPKYDCVPSSSPAIQYDPYNMQVSQWPDRVIFRYEKDDQTRTVWLDGRKPTVLDYSLQGFSVGKYEGGAFYVTTDHFLFDITGFDDYNGIPSSQLKKVTEKYWREGGELRVTVTVEDPMFLKQPASYTTRWLPARPGYMLSPWDCDPETSRAPVKMMVPKYKD